MTASELRKEYRALRDGLSPAYRSDASHAIAEKLQEILTKESPDAVLSFCPFGSEPDIRPFLEAVLASGIRLYLPVTDRAHHEIRFYRTEDLSRLVPGAMGILEPSDRSADNLFDHAYIGSGSSTLDGTETSHKAEQAEALQGTLHSRILSITPGLVFDRALHRIGYGGGFYDRFYAAHPEIYKTAVAFSCQIAPSVPQEMHDIPVDCIVTEKEIIEERQKM